MADVHYHMEDPHAACAESHRACPQCGRVLTEPYPEHRRWRCPSGPARSMTLLDLARRLHLISHDHPELWDMTPDCGCLMRAQVMLDARIVDGRAHFGEPSARDFTQGWPRTRAGTAWPIDRGR